MKLSSLLAATIAIAWLAGHRPAPVPVAGPVCVNAGPLDVLSYQILPYMEECVPPS